MVLVRDLVLTLLNLNCLIKAEYISTSDNYLADLLSRQQVAKFQSKAPWVDEQPTPVPSELMPVNYDITSNTF